MSRCGMHTKNVPVYFTYMHTSFFLILFSPIQQTTSGISHRVIKYLVVFFRLATNALNVRGFVVAGFVIAAFYPT